MSKTRVIKTEKVSIEDRPTKFTEEFKDNAVLMALLATPAPPLQCIISKVGKVTGLVDATYILDFTGIVLPILDSAGLASIEVSTCRRLCRAFPLIPYNSSLAMSSCRMEARAGIMSWGWRSSLGTPQQGID